MLDTFPEQEVSIWKKLYVLYSFFLVRKIISHIVTFTFYCIVIPVSVLVPEVTLPLWGIMYIPTTISILNAIRNPRYQCNYCIRPQVPLFSFVTIRFVLLISQVTSYNAILDSFRECDVYASDEGNAHWLDGDRKCERMGCDREIRRRPQS